MDKLSKEELLAIIAKSEKKPKKKTELTEQKRVELLDRLANEVETDLDAIFEKKYNTKFEKIESVLTEVADTQKELIKMKREKAEAKKMPKVLEVEKPKEQPKILNEAKIELPPQIVEPPRNPNIFTKGRTRF